jgi:signal transduction histidine kinase
VNEQWSELFEVAARASINERCALSYLHDVRGSMQALFSAVELLGRSLRGSADRERVDRACELARRAINQHEKTTIGALEVLTLQHIEASAFDVGPLLADVAHFLRNEAAAREIRITIDVEDDLRISAERGRLQILLVGLLTAAMDVLPKGSTLPVSLGRNGDDAVIRIGSDGGYSSIDVGHDIRHLAGVELGAKELTLLFARRFLDAGAGRLEITAPGGSQGQLQIFYPVVASSRSFAAIRESGTEK